MDDDKRDNGWTPNGDPTWTGSKVGDYVVVILAFAFFGGWLMIGAR